MKYNCLGNTGLIVSEICFGTMTFGGKGYWEAIGNQGQKDVNELLQCVIEQGINFIDTANVYSFGESEKLLGQGLKDIQVNRNEVVIATKVRGRMGEGKNNVGLSRYHIFHSVDESLQRLQLDHIDILYVHGYDPLTPLEETMRALNDIILTGKVRYIGVCNWPAWMVMKSIGIADRFGWNKFIGMQYFYSLSGRDIEREILPLAKDQGLAVMPWSPLAGGFLSGKFTHENQKAENKSGNKIGRRDSFDFPPINKDRAYDIVDVLNEIGKSHHVAPSEIALAWVRQQAGITSTIIGASNIDQLKANLHSVQIKLSEEDLIKLDQVSAIPKEYPGWMVERQSADREIK